MRFAPVHLPADRQLDRKVSMTFLKHYDACARSGLLYQVNKGGMQNVAMLRGSAFHAICERATETMILQGEPSIPPELVKVIVDEVLVEYAVPIAEHDRLREASFRWASEWTIDPARVIATETLFVLDINGWQVRAKVDFAELRAGGLQLYVGDFKSALGAPSYDEISRKRSDGTIATRNLQLIVYALAIVFGKPVRVEGDEEIVEPMTLAPRVQDVIAEFVYPSIEDSQGLMLRRTMGLTRIELEEYLGSLGAILARLERSEREGDWPAVVSDAACNECPCSARCPIPAELRDHRGEINDAEQAVEALEVLERRKAIDAALRRELKNWVAHNAGPDGLRFGSNKAARFVVQESDTVRDKEALFEAVERAVQFGEPFERAAFVKHAVSTNFKDVTLTEDELAEEAAEAAINTEQEETHASE